MSERISSFPPIIAENAKVLILGSVPGVKSLEMQQYYAHPQNQFWILMYTIFEQKFSLHYEDRIKLILENGLGLWDVIDTCERKGSLDSAIRNEEANDILQLLEKHSSIRSIFCNGQKSFNNLKKILPKDVDLDIHVMPSTSPLHTIPFEKKLEKWSLLKTLF